LSKHPVIFLQPELAFLKRKSQQFKAVFAFANDLRFSINPASRKFYPHENCGEITLQACLQYSQSSANVAFEANNKYFSPFAPALHTLHHATIAGVLLCRNSSD
jgi:hypothetical protein